MNTSNKKINCFIEGAISPEFITKSISKHSQKTDIGAHAIFLGQVRKDIINEKVVSAIEFTTYHEMAEKKIAEIREEIFTKYNIICMHVYHSLGNVDAGQICFFVFTSSKHRNLAQKACDELTNRVKKEVQIWGKEIFEDQTHQWKENKY